MLSINWSDVINVLNSCKPYLIFFGVVFVISVIAMIAVRKMEVPKRKFARTQGWIAILLALIVSVNMICFGPVESMITLALGGGDISGETTAEATELCEDIAKEGIVLLKNDGLLPLNGVENLNVFGWASTNAIYGGTGSGSISDAYEKVTVLQGLENAGFKLNTKLSDFYSEYRADRPVINMLQSEGQDWTLPEPTADSYSNELLKNAKEFSDTALIVISRPGGEGVDLPMDVSKVTYENNSDDYEDFPEGEHYLQLSQTEHNMVEMVCENFDNVLVVYNGANTLELGFLDEFEQIKGALWCPGTGQAGFNGLGKILNGEVNPSGKTVDTFAKDVTTAPSYNNFGNFEYDNMNEFPGDEWGDPSLPTFVNYVEGIYVGYRYYETAAEEGLINYDETVMYPFGYGLSYTEFEQKMGELKKSADAISFDVIVTNKGDVAGKDIVEVYYNPPYTNGGVEKASANLIEFFKTDMLEPGESQTITITFDTEKMASYDTYGAKAYVLEEGNYKISIRSDSHNIIDEKTYTVDKTIVYDESNPRSTDSITATNQFAHAEGNVTYLSRADGFANYEEATKAPKSLSMDEEYKAQFINNSNYKPEEHNNENDEMPITGAKNGLELVSMRGVDYDDEQWEALLDQLTIDDMKEMIAIGGYQTAAADSVGKIQTVDCDGPASINNNFTGVGSIGFPSATMIASTWNKDIATSFGQRIGKMADEMGVSGWYAPAMNTHRSAFSGRNFEYFSEDGVLAGNMAANATIGAEEYGVYAYLKHFALNDQETNRNRMICTWSNEQAIREIYLKPFEIAVKDGHAKAIMSAYNYIGPKYAGGTEELLTNVLRNEWGFKGMVLTDYFGNFGYMNADQFIRNGNDFALVAYDSDTNYVKDTKSATAVKEMRRACKNIMYTVVNSRAYDPDIYTTGLPSWQKIAIAVDVILAVCLIVLEVFAVKRLKRRNEEQSISIN